MSDQKTILTEEQVAEMDRDGWSVLTNATVSELCSSHEALRARAVRANNDANKYNAEANRLTRELEEARAWIKTQGCRCKPGNVPEQCPNCNWPLRKVTNDSPYLNDDQFDAIRAGDWYCKNCTSDQAKSGYLYFWESDLPRKNVIQCGVCAFLTRTQSTPVARKQTLDEMTRQSISDGTYGVVPEGWPVREEGK